MKDFFTKYRQSAMIAGCIVIFALVTLVYFSPILEGKRLKQHDIEMFKGMSKEISDYREATNEQALWTNSMFGGMPAWNISVNQNSNLMTFFNRIMNGGFPHPVGAVFIAMVGFFVLLLVLGCNIGVSFVGALAYGFTSYLFIVIGAGHNSKAMAMAYMAPVIAGIILTYRGKYLWGGILSAVAVALEVRAGHLQITYYLFLIVICFVVAECVKAFKEKRHSEFFKASAILVVAAVLGVMTCSVPLYANYEYGKDTMRGKPVIQAQTKDEAKDQTQGLDRSYITQWSYGIGETWTLLIPNAKGGATQVIGNKNDALKDAAPAFRSTIAQQNSYWGDQPYTSGPVYVGAIVCFLFVLGLFVCKPEYKWPLFVATILSIVLSWGKNFQGLTDFFIDNIPGYDKFRAVSMILVMAEVTMPFLAALALAEVIRNNDCVRAKNAWKLHAAFGITAGVCLIFYLLPNTFFNFLSQNEAAQFSQLYNGKDGSMYRDFAQNLINVRTAIFCKDTLRSFIFIALAAGFIYLFVGNKIKKGVAVGAIAALVVIDMFPIAKRYLNNDNFISKSRFDKPFAMSKADEVILKDKTLDYRVIDLTKNIFNDAGTSYFHKSVGGYHGAKLRRYQDVIDNYLSDEIQNFGKIFKNAKSESLLRQGLENQKVLNMLNTKYIIYDGNSVPLVNTAAYGNAWIVSDIKWVENAGDEMAAIKTIDTKNTAILHKEFDKLVNQPLSHDAESVIMMTKYSPNELIYSFESRQNELVVFSEIWTRHSWNIYIDGEKGDLLRADYLLRAALIPSGSHEIVMRYEPKIWNVGNKIAFVSSLIIILGFVAMVVFSIIKHCKNQ